jgi:hypothetical protein
MLQEALGREELRVPKPAFFGSQGLENARLSIALLDTGAA